MELRKIGFAALRLLRLQKVCRVDGELAKKHEVVDFEGILLGRLANFTLHVLLRSMNKREGNATDHEVELRVASFSAIVKFCRGLQLNPLH